MKRHRALIELARDHHAALTVAMRLRRVNQESGDAARAAFRAYWETHGREHFRLEEEVLFPRYSVHGQAHDRRVARALCDHVAIRGLALEAARDACELSVRVEIEQHVRFEERELFPLVETVMPDAALGELATALGGDLCDG